MKSPRRLEAMQRLPATEMPLDIADSTARGVRTPEPVPRNPPWSARAPSPDARSGPMVAGRFEIVRLAGCGGQGSVYLARDTHTGQDVAVKVPRLADAALDARFAREAMMLCELEHPGIVRYVAHGSTPAGEPFVAMEWLDGHSLAERIAQEPLELDDAVALGARIAHALAAAHDAGIVHRDVKPSNIFLQCGDLARPKLIDFGVARFTRESARAHLFAGAGCWLTSTGAMVGTPGYVAPEQARGLKDVDGRADLFSLGCVLFKCLTGRAPFIGDDVLPVLLKIVLEEAPRVSELRSGVPRSLDNLIARLLAKSPAQRPADASAVVEALGDVTHVTRGAAVSDVVPAGVTSAEKKAVCFILVRVGRAQNAAPSRPASPGLLPEAAQTELDSLTPSESTTRRERPVFACEDSDLERTLHGIIASFGGRLDVLADASLLVTFDQKEGTRDARLTDVDPPSETATDQVARGARCALALRTVLGDVPMALCAGHGVGQHRLPVGDAIERAAALVKVAEHEPRCRPMLRVDEVAAGLLDVRFQLSGDERGLYLVAEREATEVPRTLLGKPTRCVGRDRELAVLDAFLVECVSEPVARSVVVTGPAGIGKSRLRYEFVRGLEDAEQRPEVWIARGDPMSAGSPFAMLTQWIRRAAGMLEGEPPTVRRDKLRARLGRRLGGDVLVRVAQFVGELVGAPADASGDPEPGLRAARADPVLMGDQIRRAWEDWLAAECAAQPLVLVLEDLHWGDLPTIKLVDSALRNLKDAPLLVIAFARPDMHDQFPRIWSERGVQEIRLGELTPKASERLVRDALPEIGADAVARLVDRAAGNAFYLEELIRVEAEGRSDTPPETVLAMLEARLAALEPEARQVLRAASVFGRVFWRGGLDALVGAPGAANVDDWLALLASREVITPRGTAKFAGETEYVFRHALVRDAAYAMLTDADRATGHRLAGDWLERVGESDPLLLAEHFERGGDPVRSVRHYIRAARHALEGNDFDAAILRAERGVAAGATEAALGELRLVQAEAHAWRGRSKEAESAGLDALEWLPNPGDAYFSALGQTAAVAGRLGHQARVEAIASELMTLDVSPSPMLLQTLAQVAGAMCFCGKRVDALFVKLDEVEAEVELDPVVLGWVYRARALRTLLEGDSGTYLKLTDAAAEAFDQAGDLRMACCQRVNVGDACIRIGAYAEAEHALREAMSVAQRMEMEDVATIARSNLALALAKRGAFDEAYAISVVAVQSGVARGDRRAEGFARDSFAYILVDAGRAEAAEREARAAAKALESMPAVHVDALATLVQALLAHGAPAKAAEALEIATQAILQLGSGSMAESAVRLAHACALKAMHRDEEARAAIAEARASVLARGAKIKDPVLRAHFLADVPEHARTLAFSSEW